MGEVSMGEVSMGEGSDEAVELLVMVGTWNMAY